MFFQFCTLELSLCPFVGWHFFPCFSPGYYWFGANFSSTIDKCRFCHLKVCLVHMFDVSIILFLVLKVLSFVGEQFFCFGFYNFDAHFELPPTMQVFLHFLLLTNLLIKIMLNQPPSQLLVCDDFTMFYNDIFLLACEFHVLFTNYVKC
jgi:hypothetical protein